MSEEQNTENTEGRVVRDLHRRPRSRKNCEYVLISGERVKRTDIGWTEASKDEQEESTSH
ncbi:MAG: hypothetical protein Q6364_02505 [Candidatus Hermodarchaeota archaeon]|nr:hypothetical protein [Candidatus Hermodarchaeota archaeon]